MIGMNIIKLLVWTLMQFNYNFKFLYLAYQKPSLQEETFSYPY